MSQRCFDLIEKYYSDNPQLKEVYLVHVEMVKNKALSIAQNMRHLNPDMFFIEEASLLHDIGIFKTNLPQIFCYGAADYLAHGYLGREILDAEGMPRHGFVAERHTGSGITEQEIIEYNLPLPARDMLPLSLEEKIICYADCFFSKHPEKLRIEKSAEQVREGLVQYGQICVDRFDVLHEIFGEQNNSLDE